MSAEHQANDSETRRCNFGDRQREFKISICERRNVVVHSWAALGAGAIFLDAFAGRSVMTTSRREVLLQGAVIGAGVIAANTTGMEAWAQGGTACAKIAALASWHGAQRSDPADVARWRSPAEGRHPAISVGPALLPFMATITALICVRTATGISCPGIAPTFSCTSARYGNSPATTTSHCLTGTGRWIGRCRRRSRTRPSTASRIRCSNRSATRRRPTPFRTMSSDRPSSTRSSRRRRSRPSVPAARTDRTMSTSHGSIASSAASRERLRATRTTTSTISSAASWREPVHRETRSS